MSTPEKAAAVYRRYLSAVLLHGHAGAKAVDLGATDLYALNILTLTGALTPGELGRRTGLTTGPTTRLIDRLEQAGYVRRVPDPGDRRKVIVEPVAAPSGLDEALAPAREKIGAIIQDYTPEQRAVLFDYFARAATAYQEATNELRDHEAIPQPAAGGR
ncbi:MarR family winged helix-turn-helix transcriptional regulator [Nonomuraea turcica]|uniref:MarR family winged helix-turn-helix transcriptional regulator n=1 Tax=Nonomuraea sp. G32 TaxID=3067274 RepID=UPI00273C6857|nr:MarR family transcriptional regulator [Nonomuraea sp. G32]MDP4505936.1 MarR family transcriptional regulator [Nonomuraea sp. G32]